MPIYNELTNHVNFWPLLGSSWTSLSSCCLRFRRPMGKYPPHLTQAGKSLSGRSAAAPQGHCRRSKTLFFILVYQKTNPLQTMHGLHLG